MDLNTRLERLERSNQRLKFVVFCVAITSVGPWVLATSKLTPDVIQARRFEVVDKAGRVSGLLDSTDDGTHLLLFSKSRNNRAQVFVNEEEASVTVGAEAAKGSIATMKSKPIDKETAFIARSTPKSPALTFATDSNSAQISATGHGSAGAMLFNGKSTQFDGSGLAITDRAGRERYQVAVTADGIVAKP